MFPLYHGARFTEELDVLPVCFTELRTMGDTTLSGGGWVLLSGAPAPDWADWSSELPLPGCWPAAEESLELVCPPLAAGGSGAARGVSTGVCFIAEIGDRDQ